MSIEVFTTMLGKTMSSVDGERGDDRMTFVSTCGRKFTFLHHQDCCEYVAIEDVCGDIADLVGSPIVEAEEISNTDAPEVAGEASYTWTFYRFATAKGSVTVRWLGSSNGYYSEGVSFEEGAA